MGLTASIALATCNGEKYLRAQLDSLAMQSVLPNELVVCDDLSEDSTLEILFQFADVAPFPVRIVSNTKRLGYTKNFEKAAILCKFDIIFYCDQDDLWLPDKIKLVMEIFDSEPEVGQVLHFCDFIDGEGGTIEKLQPVFGNNRIRIHEMPEEVRQNSTCIFIDTKPFGWYGCMYAYRNVWTEVLVPFFPDAGHDTWSLHILGALAETRFLDKKLIHRRMHGANTTAKHTNRILRFWKRLCIGARHFIYRQTRQAFKRALVRRVNQQPAIRYPEILEKLKRNARFSSRVVRKIKRILSP